MDRLTKKYDDTVGYYNVCEESCSNDAEMCGGCPELRKIIQRLGAYEDTGLEPEEVSMYAKARAEGRIQELPCRICAEVWELRCRQDNRTGRRCDFSLSSVSNREKFLRDSRVTVYAALKQCTKSDLNHLGKTVFLEKEDAEAALERRR